MLEVVLVLAVLEGAFFVINHYRESGRRPAGIRAVKLKAKPLKPAAPARPKSRLAEVAPIKPVIKPEATAETLPSREGGAVSLPSRGKIAIVLDDWGYSPNNIALITQIKYPLTAAVLPNLNYSAKTAEELHRRGLEVILHLPMESQAKLGMEKNTILTSMSDGQVRAIVEEDLGDIVYARGVNNHMGSKATADPHLMKTMFRQLKERGLYFLDSAVTADSVSGELAESMGLPFIKRDVFLDNRLEPEYIRGQLEKLKGVAQKHGFAVGIGHDRRATLDILKEEMPRMEKEGYQFVFVSELVGLDLERRLGD